MDSKELRNLHEAYMDVYAPQENIEEGLRSAVKRLLGGGKKEAEAPKPESRGEQLRKKYNVGPEKSYTSAKRQILNRSRERADSDQEEFGDKPFQKQVAQKSKAAHDRYLKAGYSKYGAGDARGRGNKAAKRAAALNKEEFEFIVNALIEEGYDLSEYTWDEMYEVCLDEAVEQLDEIDSSIIARTAHKRMQNLDAAQKKEMGAKDVGASAEEQRKRGVETSAAAAEVSKNRALSFAHARSRKRMRDAGQNVQDSYEYDTFDTILEYLVAEGYADTNESALVIMVNMSEEWRESIMEKEDSEYEKASDAALDSRYGYGRATGDKRSFGRAANRSSAAAALRAIRRGERSGSGTSREAGSDAVHKGWAKTAKTSTDQTPEKKERRAGLANTPYSKLPDDEKEKDRVSFDAVRATYNKNKKS